MMKLICDSIMKRGVGVLRSSISRVSWYSSERYPSHNLYTELLWNRCRQSISVIPILEKWLAKDGDIRTALLKICIQDMSKQRRFTHALQIVEWMSLRRNRYAVNPRFVALHLDLLFKVHGIERVEKHFNALEDSLVDYPVYLALLNCYAAAKYTAQAEAVMNYIRKFDCCTAPPYNAMLRLYSEKRMHDKIDALIQEMQDKGILYNRLTYMILFETYALSDVERLEKLMAQMESDCRNSFHFCGHAALTAAKGYLGAGLLEKAFEFSKKAESLIVSHEKSNPSLCSALMDLMSCYATMQKKEDVYRMWNRFSNLAEVPEKAYVSMITSLVKLDDLDGAGKILDKWEGTNTTRRHRNAILNKVIYAYCQKGDVGYAEIILKGLVDTGTEPNALTFRHMALGYLNNGQMEKAVEMTNKAFLFSSQNWKKPPYLDLTVVEACLEYLQNKGDADGMQEMLMPLEKYGTSSDGVEEIIKRFFSSDGKPKTENVNGTAEKEFYVPLFTTSTAGQS